MCGLVGIAGKLGTKDEDVMKRLFCHDYWRGKDSTGLAAIRGSDNSVHIAKIASHPFDLFDMQRFKNACNGWQSKAFIGHNRAATKGAVTAVNAHPFQVGKIVGAHNGTLNFSSHRALEDAIGEKYEVDSQALIAAIDKLGIKDAIELCDAASAWALTWVNLEDNTLNFLRNKERPLWYSYDEDHSRIYWASEYWMIEAACGVNGVKLGTLTEKEKDYKYFSTEVDVHYCWDLAALKAGGERPKPKAKTIKGKEVPVKHNRQDPFGKEGVQCPSSSTSMGNTIPSLTTSKTTTSHGTTKSSVPGTKMLREERINTHHVHFVGDKQNPFAGILDRGTFENIARYGCSSCQGVVEYDDVGITIYMRDETILCPDCTSKDDNKRSNRIYVKNLQDYIG